MQLIEVKENEKDNFNHFVMENESGSFLQSYEWGEWQESLGRKVYRFWIVDNNFAPSPLIPPPRGGRRVGVIGTIQLIQMPLPFGRFYLYAPYGPVLAKGENFQFSIFPPAGDLPKGDNFQLIFNDLISKFPNAIFVRLEPKETSLIINHKSLIKSANIQPGKTLVIGLNQSEDQLLSAMHQKTRYNIKVAQRHGVIIKDEFGITAEHGLFFEEAINLLVETGKRQGFGNYPKTYFEKMVDYFALQHHQTDLKLHIYKAIYQKKLLASGIYLDFSAKGGSASGGGTRTFLFGGSSSEDKNVMAPYLMHWQVMLDANALGLLQYDFWGIETSSGKVPGFVRFKLGFGGQEKSYGGAYDFIIKPWKYKIYQAMRRIHRLVR